MGIDKNFYRSKTIIGKILETGISVSLIVLTLPFTLLWIIGIYCEKFNDRISTWERKIIVRYLK